MITDNEVDKELVNRDLEHLLKVGHGKLTVEVSNHRVVDLKCDAHRIINKEQRQLNS